MSAPIRVLVVDDSIVCCEMLAGILDREPDIETVGQANSGKEAIELNRTLRPDVVTMDLQMPGMDGFATIEEIMHQNPVPILVVTSAPVQEGVDQTFRAISVGALDLIAKPEPGEDDGRSLVEKIRLLAGIKVIRQPRRKRKREVESALPIDPDRLLVTAIVASTGGPRVLAELLGGLPRALPMAFLLTQHLPEGFNPGFIHWLNQEVALEVIRARDGAVLQPGLVYVAPDGLHLEVQPPGVINLSDAEPIDKLKPSGTPMFQSVAEVFGSRAMGVVLSGMGQDGAEGLLALRKAGGLCIAQDESSSLIYSMPQAAIDIGAVERVQDIRSIVRSILARMELSRRES